jgi:hypothetical protein
MSASTSEPESVANEAGSGGPDASADGPRSAFRAALRCVRRDPFRAIAAFAVAGALIDAQRAVVLGVLASVTVLLAAPNGSDARRDLGRRLRQLGRGAVTEIGVSRRICSSSTMLPLDSMPEMRSAMPFPMPGMASRAAAPPSRYRSAIGRSRLATACAARSNACGLKRTPSISRKHAISRSAVATSSLLTSRSLTSTLAAGGTAGAAYTSVTQRWPPCPCLRAGQTR